MGISPSEFWKLTPWQTRFACRVWSEKTKQDAEVTHDRAAWLAWHTAALPLMRRFPKFETLLYKRQSKGIDAAAIRARMAAYQAQRDARKKGGKPDRGVTDGPAST